MSAPTVLKSIKSDGWPDVIHAGKAVIRFPNGVESGNWQTRPDLKEDRTTPYLRADLPPTLSAALAVPEVAAMVEALRGALAFMERHSNRWDGTTRHPAMVVADARATLRALDASRAVDPVTKSS